MRALHDASPSLRRNRIADLLRERTVRSQEDLRRTLEREGIDVTQATLSRDLRALGVVKTQAGYALPDGVAPAGAVSEAPPDAAAEFGRLARQFVVEAEAVGNIAVLKTTPGNAHGLGVALDRARLEGIVGSVAGDDTIFALSRDAAGARRLARAALAAAGV